MTNVETPLFISSRLMAALKIEGAGTLHLSHVGYTDGGRVRYQYVIEDADGTELESGQDLNSGVGSPVDYTATMATICSFLSAAAESYGYQMRTGREGENADLFSPAVVEWAYQNANEITMAGYDLENGAAQ
jgi:hypothetical protein